MSEKAQSVKYTQSVNPATGEVFAQTRENTVEDLRTAVEAAAAAQPAWAAAGFAARRKCLLRARQYIVDNADDIAAVISQSTGKTRMDALSTEVVPITMAITWYAGNAKKILKRRRIAPGNILFVNKQSYLDHVPMGVVGIISPWNYPFAIPFHEVAMGLIAGNAVILKVASQTLEVGRVLKDAVEAGGFPKNIFTLINLPGSVAGNAFLESGINKLFFTGSVPVGKKLMAKAAERLIPVSLELGGNDAMIVCNDADPYRAACGALWAGLSNAGQSCAGVERIYVQSGIYDAFMKELKQQIAQLRVGVDTGFNVDIGSLTTESQLEKVQEHLADAREKGAVVYIPQEVKNVPEQGLFHPLAVIENAQETMTVMQEEIFGPLLAVAKFESINDAIMKANTSMLGLTASVWTRDRAKAHRIAGRLEVGAVAINDHLMTHGLAETPWGGFKESGIGRTHSALGLLEMTQPRVVVDDLMPFMRKNMWWHPHSKKIYDGLKGVSEMLYASSVGRRLRGMVNLMKILGRMFSTKG